MNWQYIANGVDAANPLWSTIPLAGNQWTGIPGSWAADVIKLKDGKYRFYYNFCGIPPGGQCTGPRSYLGVAVSDRIDGPFIDEGIFLRSGMTPAEIAAGFGPEGVTSYDARIQPNTIDPDVFYDANGKLWMVYGSYSGGIFILEMDETTGKPLPGQGYGRHLAGGDHGAIEGGYMLYSPESGYYYLFMSFGGLAANDGYNIRIARSRNPAGPFLDSEGRDMVNARGGFDSIAPFGVKMMGGFNFASAVGDSETARGYLSPGHNSAYYDEATKKHLLITHTRFPNRGEGHSIRVHEMYVNKDGWLVASPHRYVPIQGDNVVDTGDVIGDYKLINLGKDVNRTAKQSVYVSLNADGSISGDLGGKFKRDVADPDRITIFIYGIPEPFEGVLQWQWNEAAGALTPIFTAVSSKGVSLWGSRMAPRSPQDVVADVAAALALPTAAKDNSLTLPTIGARGTQHHLDDEQREHHRHRRHGHPAERGRRRPGGHAHRLSQVQRPNYQPHLPGHGAAAPAVQSRGAVRLREFTDRIARALWHRASPPVTAYSTPAPWVSTSGHQGQALRLNGNNGVRLPTGLITNYEYTVSFWINPTAITRFTPGFFAAVNERVDGAGFPFSTQWMSFLPESWDGNTMLWSGSDQWFDGSAGLRIQPNAWRHLAFSVNKGVVSVYIDGVRRFNAGTIADFFSTQAGIFALGVNYWDLPFNGMIDELKFYEAALSARKSAPSTSTTWRTRSLLASAAALLDLGDTSAVREDLRLPRSGAYASAISWSSSNPAVLSDRGQVTRPGRDQPDVDVTLTATLTLQGQITTRSFAVRVKSLAPPVPVAAYLFEDDLTEASGSLAPGVTTGNRVFVPGGSVSYVGGAVGRALRAGRQHRRAPSRQPDPRPQLFHLAVAESHGRHAVHDRVLRMGHGFELDQPGAARARWRAVHHVVVGHPVVRRHVQFVHPHRRLVASRHGGQQRRAQSLSERRTGELHDQLPRRVHAGAVHAVRARRQFLGHAVQRTRRRTASCTTKPSRSRTCSSCTGAIRPLGFRKTLVK